MLFEQNDKPAEMLGLSGAEMQQTKGARIPVKTDLDKQRLSNAREDGGIGSNTPINTRPVIIYSGSFNRYQGGINHLYQH